MKTSAHSHKSRRGILPAGRTAAGLLAVGLLLGGCLSQVYQRGYVLPEGALQQVPLGATQEQVLIVMGTPSTVATLNGEAFYYISQRAERAVAFMPDKMTDQRVIAVYFAKDKRVRRIADYGLRDGKLFDYISRTTPTGGQEANYLHNMFHHFLGTGGIGL
jgi:outer membrane protein assembly factor BamE (lipoprotein component of BamABCDE complex)